MKTVEGICKELRALDGVVGAFVLQEARCLGSSLPSQYDAGRLSQVAGVVARISQISQKAGYENSATAFHWQKASLMTWPIDQEAMLGLLATPAAVREAVQLSASVAVEDLAAILRSPRIPSAPSAASAVASVAAAPPPPPPVNSESLETKLREIQRLLVEEIGPSAKPLLERSKNKTPRGNLSTADWLLRLRNAVLAEITDPGVKVTVATSHFWADSD